ncbi:MAG: DinB family protein [Spirosomaceae bacterium]|jgi:hypothetical protein|nr:DinB family protein [Spirosomataceae bacterium]
MDISTVKKGYYNNTKRFKQAAEGISTDEAFFRPFDKANSLIWEIGHTNFFRNTIIKLLNPTEQLTVFPHEKDLFGFGSQTADASAYPSLAEVLESFEQRGNRIGELLDTTTAEHLASESPYKVAVLGATVGQQIFSLLIHEANHYGELNYVKTLIHRLRGL